MPILVLMDSSIIMFIFLGFRGVFLLSLKHRKAVFWSLVVFWWLGEEIWGKTYKMLWQLSWSRVETRLGLQAGKRVFHEVNVSWKLFRPYSENAISNGPFPIKGNTGMATHFSACWKSPEVAVWHHSENVFRLRRWLSQLSGGLTNIKIGVRYSEPMFKKLDVFAYF